MKLKILALLLLVLPLISWGQKPEYSALTIPDSMKQNANAVVRLSQMDITIASQKSMTYKFIQVTTVLNELGLESLSLIEHYNKNNRVTKIEATAYDAFGKELKRYKRKDFRDISIADGSSVFNDIRALHLDYTPITYPFTMVFEVERESSNTAFIPSWYPKNSYLASTEKTSMTINYKPELKLKVKELNFSDQYPVDKKQTAGSITYSAKNFIAKKREELSPDFTNLFPIVHFALENFHLENVDGNATNWQEFGKWYYNSLLSDTEEIPAETQSKIKALVGNEKNPIEIARIVYKYVQEKTRYVSIQIGIGGWKPMLAKDVDKLGYGDCKALTNYTRSLLKVVGVPSYFTIVYADSNERQDIQNDFASIQGNHAILTLPVDQKLIWLECTSQINPFGFQGKFTDDRNVLLIKPEGGEIVKTKTFTEMDNLQLRKGSYEISATGDFKGRIKIVSKGLQYDREFRKERMSRENQIKKYKEEFDNINNLTIQKITLKNNSKDVEFTEDLEMEAVSYAQNSGGKFLFVLNAFNQSTYIPKKYKNREFAFEIDRGYTDEDEIEIRIPEGFVVEAKPTGIEQDTEFGYYKIEFNVQSPNTITCKRKLVAKKGLFDKSKYESYRKFRETIAKTDNSKIVIAKT